jgi:hypothetical protein
MAFEIPEKVLQEGPKVGTINFTDVVGQGHHLNFTGDAHNATGLPGATVAGDGSITLAGMRVPGGASGTDVPPPPLPITPLPELPKPHPGPDVIDPAGGKMRPGGGGSGV